MNRDSIAAAIDAERAQIAHEIHDDLLPLIFAASAAVDRELDQQRQNSDRPASTTGRRGDPQSGQRLQQASAWLRDALKIGRQILIGNHPPELNNDTWDKAAQKTIAVLASGPEVPPEIHWRVEPAAENLSAAAAGACYRIVVEAIRNVFRHAAANEVTVTANATANEIIVRVTDDGSGFQVDLVPTDRFGLRTMKARARLAGGDLRVDSKPGGPTTVRLSMPKS